MFGVDQEFSGGPTGVVMLVRCGPGMPGPYKMCFSAFVGAGHAPPAFNDFEICSM